MTSLTGSSFHFGSSSSVSSNQQGLPSQGLPFKLEGMSDVSESFSTGVLSGDFDFDQLPPLNLETGSIEGETFSFSESSDSAGLLSSMSDVAGPAPETSASSSLSLEERLDASALVSSSSFPRINEPYALSSKPSAESGLSLQKKDAAAAASFNVPSENSLKSHSAVVQFFKMMREVAKITNASDDGLLQLAKISFDWFLAQLREENPRKLKGLEQRCSQAGIDNQKAQQICGLWVAMAFSKTEIQELGKQPLVLLEKGYFQLSRVMGFEIESKPSEKKSHSPPSERNASSSSSSSANVMASQKAESETAALDLFADKDAAEFDFSKAPLFLSQLKTHVPSLQNDNDLEVLNKMLLSFKMIQFPIGTSYEIIPSDAQDRCLAKVWEIFTKFQANDAILKPFKEEMVKIKLDPDSFKILVELWTKNFFPFGKNSNYQAFITKTIEALYAIRKF